MIRPPPISTRTEPLFPYPTLFRAYRSQISRGDGLWLVGAAPAAEGAGGIGDPHLHREGGVLSQRRRLTFSGLRHRCAPSRSNAQTFTEKTMKIRNSLKSLKDRHRDNRVIRRRGRTYVINKTNRRFKARQG